MKTICLFSFLLFFGMGLMGQVSDVKHTSKNAVYLELGGNGPYWSISYDRILKHKDISKFAVATGFEFFPKIFKDEKNFYGLNPQIYYMVGRKHNIEIGGGVVAGIKEDFVFMVIPRAGYRYQDLSKNGIFFKAGFTPVYLVKTGSTHDGEMVPWGGVAIGYSF
jgi:hypothetical protein